MSYSKVYSIYNKVKKEKINNMYKKLYLQEKANRLRAEMTIMQDRFALSQQELQRTEEELKNLDNVDSVDGYRPEEVEEQQ
jgi:hypothetical protein